MTKFLVKIKKRVPSHCCESTFPTMGNDFIYGGDGINMLFGGLGDDTIIGFSGKNIICGGRGTDDIKIGKNDKVYPEPGKDLKDNITGKGSEKEIQMSQSAGKSIIIEGDEDFCMRTGSDLEIMRSLPECRNMLGDIDASGKKVTIRESLYNNDSIMKLEEDDNHLLKKVALGQGVKNVGSDSYINYSPSNLKWDPKYPWGESPSIIGLYHEMVHAYNYATGTTQPGDIELEKPVVLSNKKMVYRYPVLENQAVGIPFDGLKHDGGEGKSQNNPYGYTENYLREVLLQPRREKY